VNKESEKMWREAVIAYYEFLHQQLPGGTEEYHKKTSVRIDGSVYYSQSYVQQNLLTLKV
jgi:hypothetical protein